MKLYSIPINPIYTKYLYKDQSTGLNIFKISRSSELKLEKKNKNYDSKNALYDYKINYQVCVLFEENLGRFLIQEFELNHTPNIQEEYYNEFTKLYNKEEELRESELIKQYKK